MSRDLLLPGSAEQDVFQPKLPKTLPALLRILQRVNSPPMGPRHTKNNTRSEFIVCSEVTTRSDSLLKM